MRLFYYLPTLLLLASGVNAAEDYQSTQGRTFFSETKREYVTLASINSFVERVSITGTPTLLENRPTPLNPFNDIKMDINLKEYLSGKPFYENVDELHKQLRKTGIAYYYDGETSSFSCSTKKDLGNFLHVFYQENVVDDLLFKTSLDQINKFYPNLIEDRRNDNKLIALDQQDGKLQVWLSGGEFEYNINTSQDDLLRRFVFRTKIPREIKSLFIDVYKNKSIEAVINLQKHPLVIRSPQLDAIRKKLLGSKVSKSDGLEFKSFSQDTISEFLKVFYDVEWITDYGFNQIIAEVNKKIPNLLQDLRIGTKASAHLKEKGIF